MPPLKIQVVIADDHPALLIGIKYKLAESPVFNVAGTATNSTQLISILDQHPCDVLVADYVMPGGKFSDGITLLSFIRRRYPTLKIVVFTMLDNPSTIRDLLHHGIHCILSKSDPVDHIVFAIRAVLAGKSYFSPSTDKIIERLNTNPDKSNSLRALSIREAEVIRLYASGYTINQIAEQLHRSKQTISTQKHRAMQKLGIEREVDLLKYAMTTGLI